VSPVTAATLRLMAAARPLTGDPVADADHQTTMADLRAALCLAASCLAHHEPVFWQPPWGCWVHTAGCQPCEALAGEPDPTELHCRYCRARVQEDEAGRLWEFVNRGHRWAQTGRTVAEGSAWSGGWEYIDDSWSDKCPVSPTFHHEVTALGQRSLHASQAGR
jgi:hypothetical protein